MSGVILATGLGAFGATAAASVGTGAMIAAGIGAGTTIYGGAKSFSDANKARKRGEAAQRAADKAIEEARKRVDVNAYEQLSIAKEPYELMREALLVSGATGLQSAVEGSSRGAAATAGRIQMAQGQQQAAIRAQQAQQMDELNRLVADEDKRRQQQLAGIAMEEAAGAQEAIRDAEEDRAAYIAQGVGTLGSIAEGLSSSYAEGNFGKANTRRQQRLAKEARLNEITQGAVAASQRNAALRPVTMGGVDAEGYEIPLEDEGPLTQRDRDAEAFVPYAQEQYNIDWLPDRVLPDGRVVPGYGRHGGGELEPVVDELFMYEPDKRMYMGSGEEWGDRTQRTMTIMSPYEIRNSPAPINMASFGLLPSQQATAGPLANPMPSPAPAPLARRGVSSTSMPTATLQLQGGPRRPVSGAFYAGDFYNAAGYNRQDAINNLAEKLKKKAGLTDAQIDIALRRVKFERDGSASFTMPPSELFLEYFSE